MILQKLDIPKHKVSAVLDTDTFNEIDDQFALAYMMLAQENFDIKAVLAAPFFNKRSEGPADGMEKSYEEILRIFKLMGKDHTGKVFRGSTMYLPNAKTPVISDAANRIIALAKEAKDQNDTLYVLAIGAITNVASAILLDPTIVDNIVIVWLGGHNYQHTNNDEFNLHQDVPAAQVIFNCGAPVVHIPCVGVASSLTITIPELEERCKPSGKLGLFLFERTRDYMLQSAGKKPTAEYTNEEVAEIEKVIWDISTVAYFCVPQSMESEIISSPILNDDRTWNLESNRHKIRVITKIDRTIVFDNIFEKLANNA